MSFGAPSTYPVAIKNAGVFLDDKQRMTYLSYGIFIPMYMQSKDMLHDFCDLMKKHFPDNADDVLSAFSCTKDFSQHIHC